VRYYWYRYHGISNANNMIFECVRVGMKMGDLDLAQTYGYGQG
jgi:hypothetical protein